MTENKTRTIILTALLAALTTVATMVIRIPTPTLGYIHLGDGMVLICGILLGPWLGAVAAGIGSMLADLFAGAVAYMPGTLVIKYSGDTMCPRAGVCFCRPSGRRTARFLQQISSYKRLLPLAVEDALRGPRKMPDQRIADEADFGGLLKMASFVLQKARPPSSQSCECFSNAVGEGFRVVDAQAEGEGLFICRPGPRRQSASSFSARSLPPYWHA